MVNTSLHDIWYILYIVYAFIYKQHRLLIQIMVAKGRMQYQASCFWTITNKEWINTVTLYTNYQSFIFYSQDHNILNLY